MLVVGGDPQIIHLLSYSGSDHEDQYPDIMERMTTYSWTLNWIEQQRSLGLLVGEGMNELCVWEEKYTNIGPITVIFFRRDDWALTVSVLHK